MVFTNEGLTLIYDTPEAPIPQGPLARHSDISIKALLKPICPSNVVTIDYKINGESRKPIRISDGAIDSEGQAQYFHATFPPLKIGEVVNYGITGSCAGRQVPDPSVPLGLPYSFKIVDSKEPSIAKAVSSVDAQPHDQVSPLRQFGCEFLGRFTIAIEPPRIVGSTPDGIRVTWNASTGRVTGSRLSGKVLQGADWMQIRPDGIANVDVRCILEISGDVKIMMTYSGIIELGENGYQDFLANNLPKKLPVWTTPRFLAPGPTYTWLNRLQCISIGEVSLEDLTYVYDVYALTLK